MTKSTQYRKNIKSNYEEYLDSYPEEGMITTGHSGSEFPLQSAVLNQTGGTYVQNLSPPEYNCLIEFDESIPNIESLPVEDLALLPISLLNILKIQITHDHMALWEETAYVLSKLTTEKTPVDETIARKIEMVTRLVLAPVQAGSAAFWEWNENGHVNNVLFNSHRIASYVTYPLLEGVIKNLSDGIELDGTVKSGYKITNLSGENYQACTSNEQISALRDLLYHVEESGDEKLSQKMRSARSMISDFYQDGCGEEYGLLYDKRNRTLHGEAEAQADVGIPLTMISLLIWHEINDIVGEDAT